MAAPPALDNLIRTEIARNRLRRMAMLACVLLATAMAGCESPDTPRTLGVNVRGSVSVTPTTFTGYYIYENMEGSQVRRNIQGRGNFNEVMQGRRVVLVTVRRTSTQGVIGLVVTSDGDIVYDSGMLQTNEHIIYEAP